MDSTSGKVIANVPAGNGAGDVAYDPGTREIFYASGDGTVTIAHEDAPDKITVVQTLKTAPGASVLAVDGKMHRLYLGSADFKSSDGLTIDGMAPGPNPIPGTLKILVYGN
jgi:hypothetical protein